MNTKITFSLMTPQEKLYVYTQSTQLQSTTGCIGHLRIGFDTDAGGFFSDWTDHCSYLKTEEFKKEFDDIINILRTDQTYGHLLKDRVSLSKFCTDNPATILNEETGEHGFRLNTDKYTYLLRINSRRGEYNVYCYCYKKDFLNSYLISTWPYPYRESDS